ncbi:rRNA pseudouridine synthase [Patescibacteria group bacterium]|nr:rRNA pseudouridine synthase [Patescibacteria group bacterium]
MRERLQKLIAAAGLASRRQAETLIARGQVTVNGTVVTTLGEKADPETDRITVNGKPLIRAMPTVYAFYKPRGTVCSRAHQGKAPIVTDFLPSDPPVYPIGRLDKESEGLILLTNQGDLANRLTHPSYHHPKEYIVESRWQTAAHQLDPDKIEDRLRKGVKLGDGLARADKITAHPTVSGYRLTVVVHEGRHHLLRRMCAIIGLDVTRLKRTRIAAISLGSLKPGQYRVVSQTELKRLLP